MTIAVNVTAEDIAAGKAGNCHSCPVAIAIHRATGDTEANLHEHDWELRVELWGRSMLAPYQVRDFVRQFDRLPRHEDGTIDASESEDEAPVPFAFELPDISDSEWEEKCYRCGELFDPSELDDEGVCKDCRDDDQAADPDFDDDADLCPHEGGPHGPKD